MVCQNTFDLINVEVVSPQEGDQWGRATQWPMPTLKDFQALGAKIGDIMHTTTLGWVLCQSQLYREMAEPTSHDVLAQFARSHTRGLRSQLEVWSDQNCIPSVTHRCGCIMLKPHKTSERRGWNEYSGMMGTLGRETWCGLQETSNFLKNSLQRENDQRPKLTINWLQEEV